MRRTISFTGAPSPTFARADRAKGGPEWRYQRGWCARDAARRARRREGTSTAGFCPVASSRLGATATQPRHRPPVLRCATAGNVDDEPDVDDEADDSPAASYGTVAVTRRG